jgi:hypothetical protein
MKMSAGPERSLNGGRQRLGAWSVSVSRSAVVCEVASRLRSRAQGMLNVRPVLRFNRVASIGAQLRSVRASRTVGVSSS